MADAFPFLPPLTHRDKVLRHLRPRSLLAKIIADDDIGLGSVRAIIWKYMQAAEVHKLRVRNTFLLLFPTKQHRIDFSLSGPVTLMGYNVIYRQYPESFRFSEIDFSTITMWVRVNNVPVPYVCPKLAQIIASFYPECKKTLSPWQESDFRLKLSVPVTQPLIPGLIIKNNTPLDKPRFVSFQYESLGVFCLNCGCLGHLASSCRRTNGDIQLPSVSLPDQMPCPFFFLPQSPPLLLSFSLHIFHLQLLKP